VLEPPGTVKKQKKGQGDRPRPHLRRERKEFQRARAAVKAADPAAAAEAEGPPPERRERRSLTHVGGRVWAGGDDEALTRALAEALEVPAEDPGVRAHVHGFHSYAARLHPLTARRLVESLSKPGDTVFDPFMGSGTVLVEARLQGRRGVGSDLNPLSVELAHLKTRGTTALERRALVEAALRVVEYADERRLSKAGPIVRYGKEDRDLFDVHILLELDGLKAGIILEPAGFVHEALKLVLSSILVKVSRQPGDTVRRTSPRRLATGFAIKLFQSKTEELAERLAEFAELLPRGAPPCAVAGDDARRLTSVGKGTVDLVVSSPPYPGVYDYAEHHAARLRWLGLDATTFERREIGARRDLRAKSRDEGLDEWAADFTESLRAIRRTMRKGARAVLVLADSVVQREPLYADDVIERLSEPAGLGLVAMASQKRPHFHEPTKDAFARRPRKEHLFALGAL
jgi:hypothetical protein